MGRSPSRPQTLTVCADWFISPARLASEDLRRIRSSLVGFLVLALLLGACGDTGSSSAGSKDYGEEWPFTVSSGTLSCDGPGWVTFESGGEIFAINGLASSRAAEEGWRDVNEIWANAPDIAGFGIKKDIGPIIDDGLALCENGDGSLDVSGTPGVIGKDPNELPSEEEQQAMGLHTFSDFTSAQKEVYVAAYEACLIEANAGNYFVDVDAVRAEAELARAGTGDAAREGCSDALSGTPITGSGIPPPP